MQAALRLCYQHLLLILVMAVQGLVIRACWAEGALLLARSMHAATCILPAIVRFHASSNWNLIKMCESAQKQCYELYAWVHCVGDYGVAVSQAFMQRFHTEQ